MLAPMNHEQTFALMLYATVATVTPGPNNLMLMASGANFGFRKTLPHMLGITAGFVVMISLVGLGVMRVFDAWPASYTILTVLSVGYLLYLAGRIARAAPPSEATSGTRPLTFVQAALFQWVNPKAWALALGAITIYAADRSALSVMIVAGAFGTVSLPCISTWTALGGRIRGLLTSRARLRAFNWIMATLLVVSMVPALIN